MARLIGVIYRLWTAFLPLWILQSIKRRIQNVEQFYLAVWSAVQDLRSFSSKWLWANAEVTTSLSLYIPDVVIQIVSSMYLRKTSTTY